MFERVKNNWPLKLLSMALAIAAWISLRIHPAFGLVAFRHDAPTAAPVLSAALAERRFAVEAAYEHPTDAFVVQVRQLDPAEITLRAPGEVLAHVSGVAVDVPFPAKPGTFDAMVRPRVVDVTGGSMTDVQVLPNLVHVHVRFSPGEK